MAGQYYNAKMTKIVSRDYVLCFLTQFTYLAAICLLIPTIPIYLLRFEAKAAEIGFLIGIFSISSLILRPIVGRALLKTQERKFMIAGSVFFVFSFIAYHFAPPFWPLMIVRIFHGIGLSLLTTAIFTLVANITPAAHRGQLISYFYLSGNLGFALGPYFGMLIINRFSFVVLFLVGTGLSLCSLFLSLRLDEKRVIPEELPSLRIQSILSREAVPPAIIAFMLNVIWCTLSAFFPLHALKHGVSNPGIFFVFLALTLIICRTLGGRILDIYDRKKVIILCLIAIIVALTLLLFSTTLPMFILVAIVLGTGWAFLYPSILVLAIENAGSALGPAMGTFTAFADLGAGIGPMVMGIILQWTSYPIMFLCLALTGVMIFPYFHYAIGKKRNVVLIQTQ